MELILVIIKEAIVKSIADIITAVIISKWPIIQNWLYENKINTYLIASALLLIVLMCYNQEKLRQKIPKSKSDTLNFQGATGCGRKRPKRRKKRK